MALRLNSAGHIFQAKNNVIKKAEGVRTVHFRLCHFGQIPADGLGGIMIKYTIRRFITMLFTLFIIATATFFLLAAVPGDALSSRAERLPENIKENLYKNMDWTNRFWSAM